jgi:hypothetical protein
MVVAINCNSNHEVKHNSNGTGAYLLPLAEKLTGCVSLCQLLYSRSTVTLPTEVTTVAEPTRKLLTVAIFRRHLAASLHF